MILHAGLVARRQDGYWRGVLIEGASGAGKSDLALRALDHGFRLVADDRVVVWASGGALYGQTALYPLDRTANVALLESRYETSYYNVICVRKSLALSALMKE